MKGRALDASGLCVLLDIRQPQAYLALHPAQALAAECGLAVDWLPIVVSPLKPPTEPQPGDDRGVRHRRSRARAIAREIATYAEVQGLVIEEYYRSPAPTAFNLAWLWIRERSPDRLPAFLAEAFRRYWSLALDPGSNAAIDSLLAALDLGESDLPAWRAGPGPRAAATLAEDLQERGLSRAPCYLVDGEVFVGRQHLPMIRWILEGRSGAGPI